MSKDRYSDDHTIEILQDNDFTITTGGDIISDSTGGNIASSATGNITSTSTAGEITIETEGAGKDISLKVENEEGSTARVYVDGRVKIVTETPDPDGIGSGEDGVPLIIRHNAPLADQHMLRVVNNGTIKFFVDEDGDVDCGDITCNNLTYTSIGGGAANDIIDWSAIVAAEIDMTSTVDSITLNSNNDVRLISDNDVWASATDDIILDADDRVALTGRASSGYGVDIDAPGGGSGVRITSLAAMSGSINLYGPTTILDLLDDAYVLTVENTSSNVQADGILIELGISAPETTNNWIQFKSSAGSKGAIQGTANKGYPTSAPTYSWAIKSSIGGGSMQTAIGNAQFASGNHDYGEFIEAGDLSEWDDRIWTEESHWCLGLPEGLLVWVINGMFYKNNIDNTGTPMIITNRAIILGNAGPALKGSDDNRKGEVLSFIGQLPVYIQGAVKSGDLVVPVEGESFCKCISKDDIDFKTYISAIGTAWESCNEYELTPELDPTNPSELVDMHLILCAIGKK